MRRLDQFIQFRIAELFPPSILRPLLEAARHFRQRLFHFRRFEVFGRRIAFRNPGATADEQCTADAEGDLQAGTPS